jgi:hypothetical protein
MKSSYSFPFSFGSKKEELSFASSRTYIDISNSLFTFKIASKGTKILSYFPHSANTRRSSLCFSLSLPLGCLATKRKERSLSLSLSQVLIKARISKNPLYVIS